MHARPGPLAASLVLSLVLVAVAGLPGCSQAINPAAVADAQTVARVKTALVNDATLGLRPIEVRVTTGVVRLTGRVESEAEVTRAIALARSVTGVVHVVAELAVGPGPTPATPATPPTPETRGPAVGDSLDFGESDRSLLAVGFSVGVSDPRHPGGGSTYSVAPLVRFGRGTGVGFSFGLGSINSDFTSVGAAGTLGTLRMKPIMAGLGYTLGTGSIRTSLSLVGGIAFNSLSDDDASTGPVWALDVSNSFAWRPGVSIWIELGPRAAFNIFAGYLVTRPEVSLLEDGVVRRQTLRADTTVVRAGVVYKLF